jgi:hypothetical protein
MERWNDKALDGLERRVDDHEDELVPLRPIPALVAQHERRLDRMREDHQLAGQEEVRRIEALHRRLDTLDSKLDERFRALTNGTKAAAKAGASQGAQQLNLGAVLATFLAVATAIGVPIAIALIASS